MKSDSTEPSGSPPADGAINRTLRVLSALCEHGPLTLSVLSGTTGLTPPTLLRTLRIMRDEGFAVQDEDRKWHATMLVWRLGCAVNDSIGLRRTTDRVLRDLCERIDESVVFAAFEDGWLTYAGHAEPDKPVRTHVPLGGNYGPLETQTGQAVLAWLPREEIDRIIDRQAPGAYPAGPRQALYRKLVEVAQQGYALGSGDRWPGVWGAAAPVFNHRARPIGAVGVSVPQETIPDDAPELARAVVDAARRLTAELGGPAQAPLSPLAAVVAKRGRGGVRAPSTWR
ncbi:IclR family transcriptional regulator [Amycolatopsis sp. K13G38]|uniref:IclR family transcriptional regulator n=1 Tax=Amycolatopsis acididurans TaxID=2724524 RepID=A0ABX1IY19_9PSEU|nr:IclR family transcriptional regulator [Amycolatopsis acididurans]NKQ52408.1 IclR family transcriptional regulator [Amycolatopsis acididurans]